MNVHAHFLKTRYAPFAFLNPFLTYESRAPVNSFKTLGIWILGNLQKTFLNYCIKVRKCPCNFNTIPRKGLSSLRLLQTFKVLKAVEADLSNCKASGAVANNLLDQKHETKPKTKSIHLWLFLHLRSRVHNMNPFLTT
jgi:hypothetical protein